MSRIISEYRKHLLRSTLFWTNAMILFAFVRYYALTYEVGISIEPKYLPVYNIYQIIFSYAIGGMLLGLIYASIEFLFDRILSRKIPLGLNIIIQVTLVTLSVIFISELGIRMYIYLFDFEYSFEFGWWFKDPSNHPSVVFIFVSSFVFSTWVLIVDRFESNRLFKFLTGQYTNPKEEERIFMFLDLKSSTTYAEKLGHFKYSQLIQDCFYDLNKVVSKYGAEIYQYIGDEAVLIWNWNDGIRNNRCVEVFFAFERRIAARAEYYEKKYNLLPVFKAGIHGGKLMVAQVGIQKKELAYHGDVINTTARIQGLCNEKKASLLISEYLLNDLPKENLTIDNKGEVFLRGKNDTVKLFEIKHVE